MFKNISFELCKGEIMGWLVCWAPVETALARALFGDTGNHGRTDLKDGKEMIFHHPADAIAAGIGYIPDERKSMGLFVEKTVAENIVAAKLLKGFYKEGDNNQNGINL